MINGRKKIKKIRVLSGQSMFEVIFALGIAALIMISVASLATTAVRNETFARDNALANRYAQEGMELIRSHRDADWDNIALQTPDILIDFGHDDIGSANPIPGTDWRIYRYVRFSYETTLTLDDTINAEVIVRWEDQGGNIKHEVRIVSRFTNWQQ